MVYNDGRCAPSTDTYSLELFRRATIQGDQEARAMVQHCVGGVVRGWLRSHPSREAACRLESEEHYVAQAFERFWQATALTQGVEFSTLAAALQYLHASLHGAILDTLRTYTRPGEVSLPESGEVGESEVKDSRRNIWDSLKAILSNAREQRLAFLLFNCGLKPREIVGLCPREFSDVREIYRLRCNIMERLLRNTDCLQWQFN